MDKYDYSIQEDLLIKKDLTDYPFDSVSNLRWFISLILLLGAFIISQSNIVENPFVIGGILYGSTIISLLVLDLNFFKKLFKKIELKDLLIILIVLIITFVCSISASLLIQSSELVENPIAEILNKENVKFLFLLSIFQLLLEEILFVVPFLFIYNKLKYKNKNFALIMAWVLSSEIFGLMHLPTYSYNFVQCLVLIAAVRLGLTIAYIWRKNLVLTYIIHVLYDWIILFFVLYVKSKGYI